MFIVKYDLNRSLQKNNAFESHFIKNFLRTIFFCFKYFLYKTNFYMR